MGNSSSSTPSVPPTLVQVDPLPVVSNIDGLSISSAQGCTKCVLSVPKNISVSSVKLSRSQSEANAWSEVTKLLITPSIPFKVSFNEQTFPIDRMTVFHPSPIRVENVQHDAVIALESSGITTNYEGIVILVPLVGSGVASEGFISKFASNIPGLLYPNETTKKYDSVTVPVGNDFRLDTLFGKQASELVDGKFFAWTPAPPMEKYLKYSYTNILGTVEQYGWRSGQAPNIHFIMMKDPLAINSSDLQSINMLPETPSSDALPPPLKESIVYSPPTHCDESTRPPYDKQCDPLANIPVHGPVNVDTLWKVLVGMISTIAIVIGLYYALKYAADNNWWPKFKNGGNGIGTWISKQLKRAPAPPTTPSTAVTMTTNPMFQNQAAPPIPVPPTPVPNPAAGTGLIPVPPAPAPAPQPKPKPKKTAISSSSPLNPRFNAAFNQYKASNPKGAPLGRTARNLKAAQAGLQFTQGNLANVRP